MDISTAKAVASASDAEKLATTSVTALMRLKPGKKPCVDATSIGTDIQRSKNR